ASTGVLGDRLGRLGNHRRSILALYYRWRGSSLITLHNFDAHAHEVILDTKRKEESKLTDLLNIEELVADEQGRHRIRLGAYGYRWFRSDDLSHLLHNTSIS